MAACEARQGLASAPTTDASTRVSMTVEGTRTGPSFEAGAGGNVGGVHSDAGRGADGSTYAHDAFVRSRFSCLGSPEGICDEEGRATSGEVLLFESSEACGAPSCALYAVYFDADGCAAAYTVDESTQSAALTECVLRMWQGVRFSCAAGDELNIGKPCLRPVQ
jgi:hypothetical protein